MCDYSLMHLPNRLAREGETLVTHRFPTGCVGLVSPEDLERSRYRLEPPKGFWRTIKSWLIAEPIIGPCAVCVPPGARLKATGLVIGYGPRLIHFPPDTEVTFDQLSGEAFSFRDGIRIQSVNFGGSDFFRLAELRDGIVFVVASLEGSRERAAVPQGKEVGTIYQRP